jgi:hypothetical protein
LYCCFINIFVDDPLLQLIVESAAKGTIDLTGTEGGTSILMSSEQSDTTTMKGQHRATAPDAATPSTAEPAQKPAQTRVNWFHPALIKRICDAVKAHQGYRPAVAWLQREDPVLFESLNESTVRGKLYNFKGLWHCM